MVVAMSSKFRNKRKNFNINRKGGILKKNLQKRKIFRFIGRLGRSVIIEHYFVIRIQLDR